MGDNQSPVEGMRLHYGAVSPFVRKVMICIHEKGLADQIALVPTKVGAGVVNEELMEINPTGKIPTLVTGDGRALFDSLVIIDYLDQIESANTLIPATGSERSEALRIAAIADGLLVAGVLAKNEMTRPEAHQWAEWRTAQWAKVVACIAALDEAVEDDVFNIGSAAAVAALVWLDMRAPEEDWRGRHPRLAAWFETMSTRPSVQAVLPEAA